MREDIDLSERCKTCLASGLTVRTNAWNSSETIKWCEMLHAVKGITERLLLGSIAKDWNDLILLRFSVLYGHVLKPLF
jgi:hypothetical protein